MECRNRRKHSMCKSGKTRADGKNKITNKMRKRLDYKKKYTVSFTDKGTGETVEWSGVDFKWNVVSNFIVKQDIYDNVIELLVNDEDSVGSSFLLQCLVQDVVVGQMEISVIDGW